MQGEICQIFDPFLGKLRQADKLETILAKQGGC